MITFQVFDPVVNHFDLLFHDRHSSCEVVVFPDLSGQVLHLGLNDRLVLVVGDQDTDQGDHT